ncbi:TRAP transporter small permease [Salinisphaera japonica]|uniref:TRAP transporter small permease protein n=1 Tax=Salinisphaera japonica YTM-1 TaxID=1209778 RepID=A0A423PWQ1_9GAMM|nr:TRAP transporter small permease [Salinisphaera japonica]ROO30037.1 C4-dicarboxylate ABC transporter permease [Salinisphaera japonica YTM-1]
MTEGSQAGRRSPVLVVLEAVDRVLGWAERVIVAGSVLVMALLMAAHVVGNLVFGSGIPGTYEITELLIVVMTFVGVGYATRCARHISMSAIYDTLSGAPRKALLILISLGTGALMFYFAYKSAQYDLQIFDRGRVSSSVGIPLWMVYLALPIGFSLAGLQYLLTIVRNLASPGTWRSFREREGYADVPDSGDATDGGLS